MTTPLPGYDAWKLSVPPEYERDGHPDDETHGRRCGCEQCEEDRACEAADRAADAEREECDE